LVLMTHFAFVIFAVFGGFLVFASGVCTWIHVPVVLWSSVVNLASWMCPLTPLEKHFRARAGRSYAGAFVEHYIGSVVYPGGMPRRLELIAGVSILVWNAILYAMIVYVHS